MDGAGASGSATNRTEQLARDLERALADRTGRPVIVGDLVRLSGGASRETWAFSAGDVDGSVRDLVLQRDGFAVLRQRQQDRHQRVTLQRPGAVGKAAGRHAGAQRIGNRGPEYRRRCRC